MNADCLQEHCRCKWLSAAERLHQVIEGKPVTIWRKENTWFKWWYKWSCCSWWGCWSWCTKKTWEWLWCKKRTTTLKIIMRRSKIMLICNDLQWFAMVIETMWLVMMVLIQYNTTEEYFRSKTTWQTSMQHTEPRLDINSMEIFYFWTLSFINFCTPFLLTFSYFIHIHVYMCILLSSPPF